MHSPTPKPSTSPTVTVVLLIASFLLYAPSLTSQNGMETGYYINEAGDSVSVTLRLKSKSDTPHSFIVKQGGTKTTVDTSTARVFGTVSSNRRFEVHTVNMPEYLTNYSGVSSGKDLVLTERQIVLELLLTGDVSLLYWGNGNEPAYFIQRGGQRPELLVARKYRNEAGQLKTDNRYVSQLANYICDDDNATEFSKLKYERKQVHRFVKRFHECQELPHATYKSESSPIKIKLIMGGEYAQPRLGNMINSRRISPSCGARIGVELEAEVFNSFSGQFVYLQSVFRSTLWHGPSPDRNLKLEYRSLNFALGLRKYFNAGGIRPFLSAGSLVDVPVQSKIFSEDFLSSLASESFPKFNVGLMLGLGAKISERISVNGEYQWRRNIAPGYLSVTMPYSSTNLSLFYQLSPKTRTD